MTHQRRLRQSVWNPVARRECGNRGYCRRSRSGCYRRNGRFRAIAEPGCCYCPWHHGCRVRRNPAACSRLRGETSYNSRMCRRPCRRSGLFAPRGIPAVGDVGSKGGLRSSVIEILRVLVSATSATLAIWIHEESGRGYQARPRYRGGIVCRQRGGPASR